MSAIAPTPVPLRPPARRAMLRALVVRALRDQRLAPLTWGGALGGLCALMAGLYPSMEDAIGQIMERYPPALLEAFGVRRIDTLETFIHAEMFSIIVPLAVAYLAVRSATRLVSEGEERGHLDTLLATPLPRGLLVAGSLIATMLVLAAVLLVTGALPIAVALVVGESPAVAVFLAGIAGVFALAVLFAGVAVLVAGLSHRPAVVTGVAAALLGLMYVLDILATSIDGLAPLRRASAFHYYGAPMVDGFDPGAFATLLLAGLALAAVGAWLYGRRDIRSR